MRGLIFTKNVLIALACLLVSLVAWAEQRIVAIGGDVTEIVYALGAGEQLVARDSTSTWPVEALALPSVGYMRQLNAEGILALKPTLVLASEQAQPELALKQIAKTGVNVVSIDAKTTLEQVPIKIRQIAAALQRQSQGEILAKRVNQQISAIPTTSLNTKILFILNHQGMAAMAAGQGTAADAMIRASGAENAMQGFSRYRPLSREGVIASQPDLILMTEEGIKAAGGKEYVWQLPGLSMTPAAKHKKLLIVDDMALLGFGPRTPTALMQVRKAAEQVR